MHAFDIRKTQRMSGMIDEADLLAGRVDQHEAAFGIQDRQRQPGESGAGPDVGNPGAVQVTLDREAIQEVVGHHFFPVPNGREVIGTVPALQLVQQLLQPGGVACRQLDAHTFGIAYETMVGAQGTFCGYWTKNVRLLLVEDDAMIGEAIRTGLRRDGFTVDWVHDGASAERVLRTEAFDLLLLDLGLPGKSGLQVLQGLRARQQALPVLIITARDAVSDRVQGLDAGADDYLVKPFDLDELAARIRALLRRKSGRTEPEIEHLGVALNPATHRVTRDGRDIALSPKEFALLQLLMERPGNILSRTQIEERLYGWGEEVESNAVEVHIHGLRRKLGTDFILNVRGVGYRVRPG